MKTGHLVKDQNRRSKSAERQAAVIKDLVGYSSIKSACYICTDTPVALIVLSELN